MKIGILTLRYSVNFGGILQLVSLYNYLKEQGHDVYVISYKSKKKSSYLRKFLWRIFNFLGNRNFYSLIRDRFIDKNIPNRVNSKELITNNSLFQYDNLTFTKELDEDTIEENTKDFDAIIVGSDQVWSVTESQFLQFFIDWDFKGKKISYAACTVKERTSLLNRNKIKTLLKNFDSISVRDCTSYNFVKDLTELSPKITCDPSMLVNLVTNVGQPVIEGDYLFVYILGDEIAGGHLNALKRIKNEIGLTKVVSVLIPSNSVVGENGADVVYDQCNPYEWLNLLFYSKFVFTDSFHGVMYSIHHHKNFVAYYRSFKRSTRLLDLSTRFLVSNNIISSVKELDEVDYQIDYSDIDIKMNKLVEESKLFINDNLK